jgi:tetratricopeptide (TPR) repeat protein
VRTWHRLGKIYHSTGYYDQAFMFYDSAYQAALLIKDSVQVALMLQCKGAVTADLNLFADSVLYYRQALTILKKAKKTKETIQITNALGLAQIGLGNHRAAAKSFDSALLMNKNQDFPELYAETLKHSSYLALKTKKYKRLLQLAQKAQKAYRLSDSSKGVLETQYLQAHGYYALKNYEKAARLCRHICSLDLPQDVFFPRAELYSLFGLIRFGQKKYDSAVKYLKTALEDETAHENYFGAMSDCYNLSLCYKKLNKPLKTKEYFDQMHAFETKLNERHAAAFVQENKKGNIFLRNSE